jgi:hypothetical protein
MARSQKTQTDELDALRSFDEENFDFDNTPDLDFDAPPRNEKLFLGMTGLERMFLAIFLFLNIIVIGLAILLATNRISF